MLKRSNRSHAAGAGADFQDPARLRRFPNHRRRQNWPGPGPASGCSERSSRGVKVLAELAKEKAMVLQHAAGLARSRARSRCAGGFDSENSGATAGTTGVRVLVPVDRSRPAKINTWANYLHLLSSAWHRGFPRY